MINPPRGGGVLCPLVTQWGNWKPLIKQWGNCGELNDLMRKTENWAPDDAMGKLEILAMVKLGPPDELIEKLGL